MKKLIESEFFFSMTLTNYSRLMRNQAGKRDSHF